MRPKLRIGNTDPLEWKYPATLKDVELVCAAAAQAFEKFALHKKDRFALELLLREAINNAVIHGCNQNPRLSFTCRLVISKREVSIEVTDDGAGFDWHRKPVLSSEDSDESGRGLSIYALYANSIQFNDAGNCVTLTRLLATDESPGEKMTETQVIQTDTQATIILGAKLTAEDVPNLKSDLKRLIEAGVTAISLDCGQLSTMDSTGIGCLVAAHNSLAKVNGSLTMIQVSADIYQLLCSMRLDRRINITPQSSS